MVPYWRCASFFNWIVPDGRHLAYWVKKFLRFRPSGFISDQFVLSSCFKGKPSFDLLVVQFDFWGISDLALRSSNKIRSSCLWRRRGDVCDCL